MKKFLGILFTFIFGLMIVAPGAASAGCYTETNPDGSVGRVMRYEGLVPCGKQIYNDASLNENGTCNEESGTILEEVPCQFCHLLVMANGIFDFLLKPPGGLLFIVGGFALVLSGAMMAGANILSPGNPSLIKDAKNILTTVVISLIICFSAWILVNTFFLFIGVKEWTGLGSGGWSTVNCPVTPPAS